MWHCDELRAVELGMSAWRALCGKGRDCEGDEINGMDCVSCSTGINPAVVSSCSRVCMSVPTEPLDSSVLIKAERRRRGKYMQSFHYDEVER